MVIFDEKKMEQKPVYPTKKTPSYADWALFNMGKELEESIQGGGGGEITVDQEVIAGSTNPVAGGAVKTYVDTEVAGVNEVPNSTAADVNKILTVDANGEPNWSTPLTPQVTVDQTVIAGSTNPVAGGGVKTYVDTEIAGINEVPASTSADENKILTVDSNGEPNWATPLTPQVTVDQSVIAGSTNPVAGGGVKTYVDTEVAGINEVPASTAADENKVLTVDSNGEPNWVTPSAPQITVDQSVIAGSTNPVAGGAVKTYVDAITTGYNFIGQYTEQYIVDYNIEENQIVQLTQDYINKDILVVVESVSNYMMVTNECYSNSTQLLFATFNSALDTNCTIVYSLYAKNKIDTQNSIIIIGLSGEKFSRIPDSSTTDVDKVLTVGSNGYPSWQTPSGGSTPSAHTYNTVGELATAIIQHPNSFMYCNTAEYIFNFGAHGNNVNISIIDNRNSVPYIGITSINTTSSITSLYFNMYDLSDASTSSINMNISYIVLYY